MLILSHRGRAQFNIMFSSITICRGLWRQLYFMHIAGLTVYMDNIYCHGVLYTLTLWAYDGPHYKSGFYSVLILCLRGIFMWWADIKGKKKASNYSRLYSLKDMSWGELRNECCGSSKPLLVNHPNLFLFSQSQIIGHLSWKYTCSVFMKTPG